MNLATVIGRAVANRIRPSLGLKQGYDLEATAGDHDDYFALWITGPRSDIMDLCEQLDFVKVPLKGLDEEFGDLCRRARLFLLTQSGPTPTWSDFDFRG